MQMIVNLNNSDVFPIPGGPIMMTFTDLPAKPPALLKKTLMCL